MDARKGFPAHAGMDPPSAAYSLRRRWLPRTRGDGPSERSWRGQALKASPHTRGWTLTRRPGTALVDGFPAHAGMDPRRAGGSDTRTWLPRTRGDGPFPASTPPVGATASPHTRGWTARLRHRVALVPGFPAHAGMDPYLCAPADQRHRLPRTRGDGPAHDTSDATPDGASPHTRGWTLLGVGRVVTELGFPAHAGMDPTPAPRPSSCWGLPRTRGDGPVESQSVSDVPGASPHTRGWTHRGAGTAPVNVGFPAHAGMDPRRDLACPRSPRLPRTRGDGPAAKHP